MRIKVKFATTCGNPLMSTEQEARIAQFEKMAEADPDNELGQFSLGKAYLEAGRSTDAIEPLARTLELNPKLSKAYQLLGEACLKAGRRDQAVDVLTRGVAVAGERGDLMPRKAMVSVLTEIGVTVPEAKTKPDPSEVGRRSAVGAVVPSPTSPDGMTCGRCGQTAEFMASPPFKGDLGRKIHASICKKCWSEWVVTGTKVINELGLELANPEAQETYDTFMIEFLHLEEG